MTKAHPTPDPITPKLSLWQRFMRRAYVPLMLAPVVLALVVLFGGALVMGILQSLGYAPLYGVNTFPTFAYYRDLFSTSGFWMSVFYTFYYATVPTVVGLALSVLLALALRNRFRGKGTFQYVYKLPLMIPYLVGVALVILVFSNGGIAARVLYALGMIHSTGQFPRILNTHAGWGVMIVYLWKQIPFMTLIIYSVLLGLGRESEEAAQTLGASPWKTFWNVTLPQIMPGIVSASVIVFAFNFGSFEVPFVLGAGFPNTLPVEAWRAFSDADYTQRLSGMAITIFIAAVSGVLLFLYLTLYRWFERRRGRS